MTGPGPHACAIRSEQQGSLMHFLITYFKIIGYQEKNRKGNYRQNNPQFILCVLSLAFAGCIAGNEMNEMERNGMRWNEKERKGAK